MNDHDPIITRLRTAVANPDQLGLAIKELEAFVYNDDGPYEQLPEPVQEILADLAYDLDFFEPNPVWRREDPSFFGPERAVEEIKTALARLDRHGTAVLDVLERCFPGYRTVSEEDWTGVTTHYPLGAHLRGEVVHREPFGVFLDVGVGFPALLLGVRFADATARGQVEDYPALGTEVTGRVYAHLHEDRQLALTQRTREPWMEGDW